MRLNITPLEMGEMFWYDIMFLHKAYREYMEEEEKAQKAQEEEIKASQEEYKPQNFKSQMPDINSIARGMTNGMKIPGF